MIYFLMFDQFVLIDLQVMNDIFSHVRSICTHKSTGNDTLVFGTLEDPFSSTAP